MAMNEVVPATAGLVAIVVIGLSVAGRLAQSLAPVRHPPTDDETRTVPHRSPRTPRRPRSDGAAAGRTTPRSGERHRSRPPRRRSSTIDDDGAARWCEDLSRRIRGGDSLLVAVSESSGPEEIIAGITAATSRQIALTAALAAHRGRSSALDHVLAVLITCAEVGSPAAPALDRTAAVLRDRSAVRAERRTQSAQARWSATVLTVLPGAATVLMSFTSPAMRSALLSPVGLVCLPLGVAFNAAGWLWMRRIVDRVTP